MQVPLIYRNKPLFGFDLGNHTAKMIQLQPNGKYMKVLGYGYADIPDDAIVEGILVDPDIVVKALEPLLKQMSYGKITATKVAVSLPTSKVFTRLLELPPMSDSDLAQAASFEAEQYIPVPLPDLYVDYEILKKSGDMNEVLMVAAPRAIVDSYIKLFDLLGFEINSFESSLSAVTRAIAASSPFKGATMVADFGSPSLDLTIYDGGIRLTDSVAVGGDHLTQTLMDKLGLDFHRANQVKMKYGLGESGLQSQIVVALEPQLSLIVAEIKRVAKYYNERKDCKNLITTLLLTGGAAAMPGLVEYFAPLVGMEVAIANPWLGLEVKGIQSVNKADIPLYATAIGLARLEGTA